MTQWRWPNFTRSEMQCRCGCGLSAMEPEFMDMLQAIRTEYGKPMVVSSAFRCPSHNDRVSSTGLNGPHTTGKAVDVAVSRGNAMELLRIALTHGVTGIGVQQKGAGRFLHLDALTAEEGPRPTLWSY